MLHTMFADIGPIIVDLDLVAVEACNRKVPEVEGVLNEVYTRQDVLDGLGIESNVGDEVPLTEFRNLLRSARDEGSDDEYTKNSDAELWLPVLHE